MCSAEHVLAISRIQFLLAGNIFVDQLAIFFIGVSRFQPADGRDVRELLSRSKFATRSILIASFSVITAPWARDPGMQSAHISIPWLIATITHTRLLVAIGVGFASVDAAVIPANFELGFLVKPMHELPAR